MRFSKLAVTAIALAALALPVVGSAEDAKPGEFRIPGTNTTLKLNGFVEFDVTYDFDGSDDDIRGNDWSSFIEFQPLDDDDLEENMLYMTGRTSRLGLTTTTPIGGKNLVVRLEGDFNSPSPFNYSTEATTNGNTFRVRHAYGEYAGLLVGQTWSNFMDGDSLPDTVDFNGHGAFVANRHPMIRYAMSFGGPSLSIALENPQSITLNTELVGAGDSLTVGRRYDRVPDVTASLTIPFSFGHVNLRAVGLEYQGRNGAGNDDAAWGWGAGASGSLKFGAETIVWSVQGGDGIGKYTFQSLFQGAAFVGDEIEVWRSLAYHVGLTHAWTPNVRTNVIWTQTFFDEDDELAAVWGSIANKRVDVGYVNTFFNVNPQFTVGLEYAYGQRVVFEEGLAAAGIALDNDKGTQHRANALVRYTFF
jgi:hypothetical protein